MHQNPNNIPATIERHGEQMPVTVGAVALGETNWQLDDTEGRMALDWVSQDVAYAWQRYDEAAIDTPPPFSTQEEVISKAAEFLRHRPIEYFEEAIGEDNEDPEAGGVYVASGMGYEFFLGSTATANLTAIKDESGKKAEIGAFMLEPNLRGKGIGSRLMRGAMATLKDEGVEEVVSRNVTADALQVRVAVFGEANLEFIPSALTTDTASLPPVPRNAAEAQVLLQQIYANADPEKLAGDGRTTIPTFGIRVNLKNIDTSKWETAIPEQTDEAD